MEDNLKGFRFSENSNTCTDEEWNEFIDKYYSKETDNETFAFKVGNEYGVFIG